MNVNESYRFYSAIKIHFNCEKYDFFERNGSIYRPKVLSKTQYNHFEKLGKKYDSELIDFYVSNFLENPKISVYQLINKEAEDVFIEWKKRNQAFTFRFKEDLVKLIDNYTFEDIFKGDYPKLLTKTLQYEIMFESFVVLNHHLRLSSNWDSKFKDNLIWKPISFKSKKYYPFIRYDKSKIKEILVNCLRMNT